MGTNNSVKTLNLRVNKLKYFSSNQNKSLKYLDLYCNALAELDLTQNRSLTVLMVALCKLKDVKYLPPNLEHLWVD
jgi:Leucine-rich repeat (LRR) protein